MKIRLQAVEDSGCAFFRMREPARVAAQYHGVETEVVRGLKIARRLTPDGLEQIQPQELDCDVIVLQRPADMDAIRLTPIFQKRGIAVVADLDDDLSCLHAFHPGRTHFNPNLNAEVNWRILGKVCQMADLVTVSTPILARRFGAHGRVRVLRNCLPQSILDIPVFDRDGLTVGWSGWTVTHPGDLQVTHGGVGAALEDTNARFHVIGSADGVRKQLGLMREPSDTGFIEDDMPKWHRELGALDVGIVPLASTRFNESKSYLKGLEFAARGVPFVASPLPEYELLAANDIGVICPDRGRSWRSAVARLVNDSVLRDEMAAKGRQIIEEEHTYEVMAEDWIDAWEQAVQNRAAAQRTRAAA